MDAASARFRQLYAAYSSTIYTRCRRILGDGAAAEDAAQETFLRVHRHIETAPCDRDVLRWIFRIATNYCLNVLRDRRARPTVSDDLTGLAGIRSPEDHIADRDLGWQLTRRAPPQMRDAAVLYHVYGLVQSEIAEELGVSRRTVVNYLGAFADYARRARIHGAGEPAGRLRRTTVSRRTARPLVPASA
ncbi:MAG TPA: sigma-70 family RNA polymerase sigma factor [Polyangia bacterium]|nr:sigma-70 family RNA polymerase sigma factor [Polyangia bacterium]